MGGAGADVVAALGTLTLGLPGTLATTVRFGNTEECARKRGGDAVVCGVSLVFGVFIVAFVVDSGELVVVAVGVATAAVTDDDCDVGAGRLDRGGGGGGDDVNCDDDEGEEDGDGE